MSELVSVSELKTYFFLRRGLFRSVPVHAVDGVTLTIDRGETLGLVGESGSGKTTLGRTVLRLIEPVSGEIFFDGEDITHIPSVRLKEFRRRAQAVFQDPYSSISPYMNVRDIVEEPLQIHGFSREERDEKIVATLDLVKMPGKELASKFPHNLSGGQRQRVCIARALVLDPEFIVADEPVSMVDASNRAEILYLLRELQEERQLTFLYITHDIASARHFSDRIAVMYLGTLAEIGLTGEVVDGSLHPYTQALLAAVPEPDPANRRRLRDVIPGEPPNAVSVPEGCPFHPRCPRYMKGRCEKERPEIREVSPGHRVACFLYES